MTTDEQLAALNRDVEWLRAEMDRHRHDPRQRRRLVELRGRAAWLGRELRKLFGEVAGAAVLLLTLAAPAQIPMPTAFQAAAGTHPAPEIPWRWATITWHAPAYDGPLAYRWLFENAHTNRTGHTTETNARVEWILGTNRFSVRSENATNSGLASGWVPFDRRSYATGTFTLLGVRQGPDWRGALTRVTNALPWTMPMSAPEWWFVPDYRVSNWWAIVPL